jgi:hypothetical protein
MHDRPAMAAKRNRLRKIAPRRMVNGEAAEMLAELDWWGIPRPRDLAEAERAKSHLLREMAQEAGSPGDAALRAAGFALLSWWYEQGKTVTATKLSVSRGEADDNAPGDVEGNAYAPSDAVAFLAEQLPRIQPWLGKLNPERPGWTPALDAAYTIARKWLGQDTPHWTVLSPLNGPIAMDLRKPGGIR